MRDVTPTECYNVWVLRLNLYVLEFEQSQVAEQFPEKSPEYLMALLKLQNHLNGCQQCIDYLRYYSGHALPQPTGGE